MRCRERQLDSKHGLRAPQQARLFLHHLRQGPGQPRRVRAVRPGHARAAGHRRARLAARGRRPRVRPRPRRSWCRRRWSRCGRPKSSVARSRRRGRCRPFPALSEKSLRIKRPVFMSTKKTGQTRFSRQIQIVELEAFIEREPIRGMTAGRLGKCLLQHPGSELMILPLLEGVKAQIL